MSFDSLHDSCPQARSQDILTDEEAILHLNQLSAEESKLLIQRQSQVTNPNLYRDQIEYRKRPTEQYVTIALNGKHKFHTLLFGCYFL